MKIFYLVIFALFLGSLFSDCKKSTNTVAPGTTPVKVRMSDAPGNYGEVNIQVTGVEFKMENGTTVDLNVHPGVYNLLDLVNGKDTLLATDTVGSGKLSQIRLILGSDNTIKLNGLTYPVTTPSSQQSGLKLNVNKTLVPGVVYNLLLDFDAGQSIVTTGNGTLILKPVIRVIDEAITGSISGSISNPSALPALITAVDQTDSLSTITDSQGKFLLRGVPAGKYVVTITPQPAYQSKTFSDVTVTIGNQTNIGAIAF